MQLILSSLNSLAMIQLLPFIISYSHRIKNINISIIMLFALQCLIELQQRIIFKKLIQMQMKVVKILLIILVYLTSQWTAMSLEVQIELPELKNDTYAFQALDPVNVTIGEQFSIGIFQIDLLKIPQDLKVYEISQQKFFNMFETLEKHTNINQDKFKRQEIDNNIFTCSVKNPTMQIIRTLSVFKQNPTNKFNMNAQQSVVYVPIGSKQLLYLLDTATMELQVYHFTPQKLIFMSSAKINAENINNKIAIASSSNEQFIYIFSNEGMWSIQTKTVLTNVQRLTDFNGFNSIDTQIDKLYHGAYNYIYALKRSTAVYVIPQQPNSANKYITITKYNNIQIIPQDIYIDSRLLYILDLHEGIYIFHILGDGKIIQYDHIVWRSYGNLQMVVKQYSIFIRYFDQDGQKIVEINYNSDKHHVSLVRYYKSDQIVSSMSLQTVPVYVSQRSYTMNQPFLFLTADNGQIEIFPYNVDPRVINTAHNSIKMHVQNILKLIYLFQDIYLISTKQNLLYTRIRIQKPELKCFIPKSTGHVYYQLQFSSNISTCQNFDHTFAHKNNYNYNCRLVANYAIYIDDPDLSRLQKALLYGVVFLVVAFFVAGLLCLIQWRNNKLSLIGRIKDQIIKLRDRYRKMQPFTQEQPENHKNSVEFQLPEVPPIPTDPNG